MPRRPSRDDLAVALAQAREELRRSRRENRNLRRENQVLREAAEPLIHHAPARERFTFIHERRDRFSAKLLCRSWLPTAPTVAPGSAVSGSAVSDSSTSGG
jgi:hypothetical protein